MAERILAFAVIDEIHAIADEIESVFRLRLDVLPVSCRYALQRDEVHRQRRILGMRGARLEVGFPPGNSQNRRGI